ncbi:CAP domain-containing protein [Clostridium perfringens]
MKKNKLIALIMTGAIITGTAIPNAMKVQAKEVQNNIVLTNVENLGYGCATGNGEIKDSAGNVLGKTYEGDMLIINSNREGKNLVTDKKTGIRGYINNENFININDGDSSNVERMNRNGVIKNVETGVNVRELPSMDSSIKDVLTNGTAIRITGKTKQWYRVSINGVKGFIFEEYVNEGKQLEKDNTVANRETNKPESEVVATNKEQSKSSNFSTNKVEKNNSVSAGIIESNNNPSTGGDTVTKPENPSTGGDTVTKPENPSTGGDTVTKPENPSTGGDTTTKPENPSTGGDTATKPENPSTGGDTTTKPENPSTGGDTVTKPENPSTGGDTTTKPENPSTGGDTATKPENPSTGGDTATKPENPSTGGDIATKPENPSTGGDTTTKPENPSTGGDTTTKPEKPSVEAPQFQEAMTQQLWSDFNSYRKSKGLNTLNWSNKYANWTKEHAKEMAEKKSAFHKLYPEGGQVTGLNGANMTASKILEQFKNSPAHDANLLDNELTEGACAIYKDSNGVYYFVIGFDY